SWRWSGPHKSDRFPWPTRGLQLTSRPVRHNMKFCVATLFLFAFALQSEAMDDGERKVQECRANVQSLIGLDRDEVHNKCGPWDRSSVIVVQNRRVEMLVWGPPSGSAPVLVLYLGNGKVTGAQSH